MSQSLPVRETMCATCPFRENSKYQYLRKDLELLGVESSRICHSTGANNAINKRTSKPESICRGSRNHQLQMMADLRVIDAPTDTAWNVTRIQYGLKPVRIQDPK